jgi:hypothetical protein
MQVLIEQPRIWRGTKAQAPNESPITVLRAGVKNTVIYRIRVTPVMHPAKIDISLIMRVFPIPQSQGTGEYRNLPIKDDFYRAM